MLQSLSIRDFLLVSSLDLDFRENFSVFTGETGAGKSLLLEALGFVLGEKGQASFIRTGAQQTSVGAVFSLRPSLVSFLEERGISPQTSLLIRRVLFEDGRSKAYLNDCPVSVGILREMREILVEIHGQFDHLLNPSTHRDSLDRYGGLKEEVQAVEKAYAVWKRDRDLFLKTHQEVETLRSTQSFLRQAVEELSALNPQEEEETHLIEEKTFLSTKNKLLEGVEAALSLLTQAEGIQALTHKAYRVLDRLAPQSAGKFVPLLQALDQVGIETQDIVESLETLRYEIQGNPTRLEAIEERLQHLRSAARKYNCPVVELASLLRTYQDDLDREQTCENLLTALQTQLRSSEKAYLALAQTLSQKRREKAERFVRDLSQELAPLKLERADFSVSITPLEVSGQTDTYTSTGLDAVEFLIRTNPGAPQGPLRKIASGGERSRLMLALKVVLAEKTTISTLIFDEIDAGVGGAVASAIGERLHRVAESTQVIVITHSPQVAAFGTQHFKVMKDAGEGNTQTSVVDLSPLERREEIARMLAGKSITEEARAAADQLLCIQKKG